MKDLQGNKILKEGIPIQDVSQLSEWLGSALLFEHHR